MSKQEFASKFLHEQYLKKLEKKNANSEIESYVADSKRSKYKHRVMHSRRK